jgi:hypothetical protein
MSQNQTCPNCGAPIYSGKTCEFCGDTRVEADRQQNCRTFILHINEKLLDVPPLAGWALLLTAAVLPVLFILCGFWFAKSILAWVCFILLALISIPAVILISGILRENYQMKLFYTLLYPCVDTYITNQKYSIPEFISEIEHAIPPSKQPVLLKFVTVTMAINREQYIRK